MRRLGSATCCSIPEPGTAPFHYIFATGASPGNPFSWHLIKPEPMLGPAASGNIRDRGPSFPWVVPCDDEPWLIYYGASGTWAPPRELCNRTGSRSAAIRVSPGRFSRKRPCRWVSRAVTTQVSQHESYLTRYTGGERYQPVGDVYRGIVHIGMARSKDGIDRMKYPETALRARLDAVPQFEAVVFKPSVLLIDGVYHMWLSVFDMHSQGYWLGYARSSDGVTWTRYYKQILPLTPGGFDSANQSYPFFPYMSKQL